MHFVSCMHFIVKYVNNIVIILITLMNEYGISLIFYGICIKRIASMYTIDKHKHIILNYI